MTKISYMSWQLCCIQWDIDLVSSKNNIGKDIKLCKRNHIIINTIKRVSISIQQIQKELLLSQQGQPTNIGIRYWKCDDKCIFVLITLYVYNQLIYLFHRINQASTNLTALLQSWLRQVHWIDGVITSLISSIFSLI